MASPNQAEFFGPTLRIVLPSGVGEIGVENNLYSQWKEWVTLGTNARFPPAFRTIGGDPLTPGVEAGAYFFLQNQDGWRIRPAEEDATVLITGNLAPEDSTVAMAVPTLGAFTVLLLGLQPVTQAVDVLLTQSQEALYNGVVHINTDPGEGTAGTEFPVGTASTPCSNLADSITIAASIGTGIKKLICHGLITLDRDLPDYVFVGVNQLSTVLDINGFNVGGSEFVNITLVGDFGLIGSPLNPMSASECRVNRTGITEWTGNMRRCSIAGNIALQDGQCSFIDCTSEVAGTDTPVVERNGTSGDIQFRRWAGGLEIENFSNGDNCSIDLVSGHVKLGPTNTDGTIVLRGVGKLTNTLGSPSVVLDKDGFIDGRDVKLIKALTGGNAVVSLDDLTVTIYDPDIPGSPQTILATYAISSDGRIRTRTA